MRISLTLLSPCLLAIMLLAASSCDYPEAGYFALVGVGEDGQVVASHPFLVDELTDDSSMTIGFTLLIPREGELVELPLQNGIDLSRRYWEFAIADQDTGAGTLACELSHQDDRLWLHGAYMAVPGKLTQEISGWSVPRVNGSAQIVLGGTSLELPAALQDVLYFEIRPIEKAEFEEALGIAISEAKRVLPSPVTLDPTAPTAAPSPAEHQDKPGEEAPKKPPPNMGGRR